MPVNFDPAQPFAPNISERFGETEQYNKTLPTLAALYEAQGRNFTQASAGTAANITRASEESAKLAGDRINQDNQLYFQRQQQAAQIEAQKQSQIRDIRANEAHQFNQMAFQQMQVSDAEQKDMVRKQNGLDLIRQQLDQKLLTPEEAAPYIAELATGINFTQRRVDNMRAKQMQQAQEMKQQQIASDNKDRALAEKFRLDMAARGITMTAVQDKTTGKWHTIAYDEKSNRIYNPFNEHAGKEEKPQTPKQIQEEELHANEWGHLGTNGNYDIHKGEKDAETWANKEATLPNGKPAPKGSPEWEAMKRDRWNGTEREFKENVAKIRAQRNQGASPQQSQQQDMPSPVKSAVDSLDKMQSIFNNKLKSDPFALQVGNELLAKVKRITTQYPSLNAAPEQVQQEYKSTVQAIRELHDQLK